MLAKVPSKAPLAAEAHAGGIGWEEDPTPTSYRDTNSEL